MGPDVQRFLCLTVGAGFLGGFKFKTLLLANISFPIYIKAFFNALAKRDQSWNATNSVSHDSPFNYVRVQVYVFLFLLLTSFVGIAKSVYTDQFSISLAWNALNTFVFGYFVVMARAEGRVMRAQRKAAKRRSRDLAKADKLVRSKGIAG